MLWVYDEDKYFLILQYGDWLYTSESDVYRRQILTTQVDPRAVRFKIIYWLSNKKMWLFWIRFCFSKLQITRIQNLILAFHMFSADCSQVNTL